MGKTCHTQGLKSASCDFFPSSASCGHLDLLLHIAWEQERVITLPPSESAYC